MPATIRRTLLVVFLFIGALASRAAAQATGQVQGRVVDSTGNALPGARVETASGTIGIVTGRDGGFTLNNLPVGSVQLRARYIGFAPSMNTVEITAGRAVRLDIVLKRLTASLPDVTVQSSRARGEVQALAQQQSSDNIVNVVPAEIITSLPNTNVADAIGRVAGVTLERDEGEGKYVQIRGTEPRLTNLTINGIRVPNPEAGVRNAKLDIIPSEIVGSIEIHKTLSADMDGDAIGGSVNLVTREATEKPYLVVSGYGGYTSILSGRGLYQGALAAGKRFGARQQLGLTFGGSYDWNGRGIDDIEPAVGSGTFNGQPAPVATAGGIDLREYQYQRQRLALSGGADYRLGAASSLFFKALYSNFHNYGDRWVSSLLPGGFNQSATITDTTGSVERQVQTRRPNESVYSLLGGGNHAFGGAVLDYGVAYSRAQQVVSNALNAFWITNPDNNPVAWTGNFSNPDLPRLAVANGVNINDPTLYDFEQYRVANNKTFDREVAGRVNVAFPYATKSGAGSFKIGGQVRDGLKVNTLRQQYFDPVGAGGPNLSAVLSSFTNSGYYGKNYDLGPVPDIDKFSSYFAANPTEFAENVGRGISTSDQGSYRTKERVSAAYAMETQQFGALNVQAGVRIEHTQSDYNANKVLFNAAGVYSSTTPVTGSASYTNVLPSVNLRYALDAETNLRASYGRGLARPNFSDLPPFLVENDRRRTISSGNPDLKPTQANNFDVVIEHFFASVGVLSGAVYYKDMKDYIASGRSVLTAGPFSGYTQTQPINLPGSHVAGVELAWQQHLSFLPGSLGNLGLLTNFTANESKTQVPGRDDSPRLLRTAPTIWNVGLTYDDAGFSARLGATHNSHSIYGYNYSAGADLGPEGPNGDVYLAGRTQVDAQASYRFGETQLFANVLNLNNAPFAFYQGSAPYIIQRELYGPSFTVGLRLTR